MDGHRGLRPTKVGQSMLLNAQAFQVISYFICLKQEFAVEDKLIPAIQSLQVFLKSCRFVAVLTNRGLYNPKSVFPSSHVYNVSVFVCLFIPEVNIAVSV